MTEGLPDPLVPAEVDLRGLDYMPLFGNHLFGSEFNARASDGAWRAGVTLWWAAWNQQPAGSLPDDDGALCRLADLGRDVKAWKALREMALRGFLKCSDGRLYHPFLCKQVLVAWGRRTKERDRKAAYRAQKEAEKAGQTTGRTEDVPRLVPRDKHGTSTGTAADGDASVRAEWNGSEAKRSEAKEGQELRESWVKRSPEADLPEWAKSALSPPPTRDLRIPEDWQPTELSVERIRQARPDLLPTVPAIAADFRLWAQAQPGPRGESADWQASFLRWAFREKPPGTRGNGRARDNSQAALEARNRAVADAWEPPEVRDGTV